MGNMGHVEHSAEPITQLCEPPWCWGVRTSQEAVWAMAGLAAAFPGQEQPGRPGTGPGPTVVVCVP